jgi:hypothetical protein
MAERVRLTMERVAAVSPPEKKPLPHHLVTGVTPQHPGLKAARL